MINNIEDYNDRLEELISMKSDVDFPNKGAEHGAYVLSKMFKYSTETVKIYCEYLDSDLTKQDVFRTEWIQLCKKANSKFKFQILCANKSAEDLFAYKTLCEYGLQNNVKYARKEFIDVMNKLSKNDILYFTIAKGKGLNMIREQFDSVNLQSACSFNQKKSYRLLEQIFDLGFELS